MKIGLRNSEFEALWIKMQYLSETIPMETTLTFSFQEIVIPLYDIFIKLRRVLLLTTQKNMPWKILGYGPEHTIDHLSMS